MLHKKAPSLDLPATGGKIVNLQGLKQSVVLYFYPKDDTPGCAKEGADFTKLHKKFQDSGAVVFGVSKDSISSHEKFKKKQKYSFDLISDEQGKLCEAFSVLKEKSMFGKTYLGIERSTFLISAEGVVQKEWRKVKVEGHAEEVLKALKNLNS
ncbi:MAG: peroxiredoxin [Oligoflexia bacterium]|nr:peroxiredoxin [Oligoflexia bacterium]